MLSKKDFTRRELELLPYLCEDMPYAEIADALCITVYAVKFHVKNLRKKTGILERVGFVPVAMRLGLWHP